MKRRDHDEYQFKHSVKMNSWRRADKHDDTLNQCIQCGELTKINQRYCSLFCRIEHQQSDN